MINEIDDDKNKSDLPVDKVPLCIEALKACISHASDHYGTTITDLARLMDVNKWTLFKWVEHGRMPVGFIKEFESHCHARYVTKYLAEGAGLILVPKAKGLDMTDVTLVGVNQAMATAISTIANYMDSKSGSEAAIKSIDDAMEMLAAIKRNIGD